MVKKLKNSMMIMLCVVMLLIVTGCTSKEDEVENLTEKC